MNSRMFIAFAATVALLFAADAFSGMGYMEKSGSSGAAESELMTLTEGHELIGSKVVNREAENLGLISEVVIDKKSNSVVYVVLETTEMMMKGGKLVALPFSALTKDFGSDSYILDVSRAWLANAPSFDRNNRPNMADRKWGAEIYKMYGKRPYWEKGSEEGYEHGSW